jgi:hypothetical protein
MLVSARMIVTVAAAAAFAGAASYSAFAGQWKIIDGQKDPLTDNTARYAVALPQSNPVFHGQPVTSALVLRCTAVFTNRATEPELMLLFTGLTGLGHIRNVLANYRWDEGPVRSYKLKSGGAHGTRAIELPKLVSPTKLVEGEDPVTDVVAAKRFRAEVQFASGGSVFLDINVAGANDAIRALACH